jgi:Lrp/AsnC family leucine-responsive transcriptional regulator
MATSTAVVAPQTSESLDELDRRILGVLRDDARTAISQLARAVFTSRANAYARLQRLVERGVVRGYSATVDPVRVGTSVTAIALVSVDGRGKGHWRRWRQQLEAIPAVEYAALVAGDTDLLLILRARDQEDLRAILLEQIQGLDHVGTTRTLTVLDELVHRPFVLPES